MLSETFSLCVLLLLSAFVQNSLMFWHTLLVLIFARTYFRALALRENSKIFARTYFRAPLIIDVTQTYIIHV